MENMYQQAILDAKSLRASAMANAKTALQEAFEPKIQEMVRLKLSEELEENDDQIEEEVNPEDGVQVSEVDDTELDEILAELDSLSEDDGEYDEVIDNEENEEDDFLNEADDDEVADDEEEIENDEEEIDADEEQIADDELDAESSEETVDVPIPMSDLGKLLDIIKNAYEEKNQGDSSEDTEDDADMGDMEADTEVVDDEESISLDEILAELEQQDKAQMEEVKMKNELNEAKKVIKILRESLSEVNLLNAKLLYMNKIFKSKSLSESQKVNVVKSFDKASSVKEVKHTYEIIKESMTVSKKSPIRESFGYASKPAGVSPNANVIEADSFISRWQKIAGI